MFRALCALLLLAGSAQGAIINGDFETGDLTGWNASYQVGPPFSTAEVVEHEGSQQMRLSVVNHPDAAVFLEQTFTGPGYLSFDFDIVATNTNNFPPQFLAQVDGALMLFFEFSWEGGSLEESGTYVHPTKLPEGTHKIIFAAYNNVSASLDPTSITAYIDNVQFVLPEPSTFLLAGFLPLAFALKRLQQRK